LTTHRPYLALRLQLLISSLPQADELLGQLLGRAGVPTLGRGFDFTLLHSCQLHVPTAFSSGPDQLFFPSIGGIDFALNLSLAFFQLALLLSHYHFRIGFAAKPRHGCDISSFCRQPATASCELRVV